MRFRELVGRLTDRAHRERLDAELDEELRHHRALLAQNDAGTDRTLGNTTYYKEETRAMWSLGLIDDLLHDARYAVRVLRRDAGFTAAVILTLALGIGANTAVFSIVNAVLLRPLPYAQPEKLYSVWIAPANKPEERNPTSLPDLRDWERQTRAFSAIGAYVFNRFDITGAEGDAQARGILGTRSLYDLLGAKPFIGRLPRADEESQPVVTISYRLWQERFGGSPNVIGKRVGMNNQSFDVVGVMPPGFHFPSPDIDLWTTLFPLITNPTAGGPNPWMTSRSMRGYRVVGRLASGVSGQQAEREMNVIEHRLAAAYPDVDGGLDVHVQSVRDDALSGVQRGLWTVFGAAVLILLLACVNVAHLLLARMSSRGRELAVRRALGAHRGRVLRQLITESVVLGVVGGAAGVALAVVGTRTLIRFTPPDVPRLENVAIDVQSLVFALGVSILAGLLFGAAPALIGWGRDVHTALRERTGTTGTRGGRVRSMLTSLEVAFAVILLVGAGLMLRSFMELTSSDLGVHPNGVTVAQALLIGERYATDEAKIRAMDEVLANIRAIPGVTEAGASTSMPPTRMQEAEGYNVQGRPEPKPGEWPIAIYIPATSGYFEALRMELARGRTFDSRDNATGPRVAVINRALAKREFPNSDPVGQHLDVGGVDRTIIGVVGDAVYEGVGTPVKPAIYVPFSQQTFPGMWIAIRSSRDASALTSAIRDAMHRVDPEFNVHAPRPLDAMIAESIVRPRFHAWLLGAFGGLALVLASIGIYSVIAYGVTQRRSEIGIRLALGAPARRVVGMIVRGGMLPVGIGMIVGLGGAYFGARVVSGLLYGIAPTDGVTFAGVALVLGTSAFAAAFIPARRAAAVDPLSAIRAD